jgi:hypothetical protein
MIEQIYTVVALIVAGLLVYVMQRVEVDRVSRFDSLWLQWTRRLVFTATAVSLLFSINSSNWEFTCLALVSAAGLILMVNAIAMHLRSPPKTGRRAPSVTFVFHRVVARMSHYFSQH